jgi:hypothetical protein
MLSLSLERFDYARVGEHLAVMQVLARVAPDQSAPAASELAIYAGPGAPLRFPARACRTERRLLPGGTTHTLWRALFTVPVSAVECTGALFELGAGAGFTETVILPVPEFRHPGPAALQLIPADALTRPAGAQIRQAVAVATAVAVTATSTPALAVAASAAPVLHASGTQERITDQLRLAQDQLARQKAHAGTPGATAKVTVTTKAHATVKPAARPGPEALAAAVAKHRGEGLAPSSASARRPSRPGASGVASTTGAQTATGTAGTSNAAVNQPAAAPAPPPAPTPSPTAATTAAPSGTVISPSGTVPLGNSGGVAAGNTGAASQPSSSTPSTTPPAAGQAPAAPTGRPSAEPGSTTAPRVKRSRPEPSSHRHGHGHQQPRTAGHARPSVGGAPVLGGLNQQPPARLSGTSSSAVGVPTLSANPPGFYGPKTWTGTVTEDPALAGVVGNLSNLLANGDTPPGFLIPIYMEAGHRYGVPWEVLAAINAVESDYGRNLNTSSAGAIGWMQFEPATWREWGVAADGHNIPNPYDPRDAIFSAARYLAAAGADRDIWGAIYAYNHASWYVDMVMSRARAIAANIRPQRKSVRRGVVSVYFATSQAKHPTVGFRGGFLSHYVRLVASANMVSAANFPYVWGGGHEQPARFAPFDCSGSVSYTLQQAGYRVPTSVSGNIGSWGFPRGPGRVTIFYNPTHTFMRIGNRYFGTSGFARPGGGAGWFSTNRLPASYLAQFSEVHVPALGANSFSPHRRLRLRTAKRKPTISTLSSTGSATLSQLSPYPSFSAPTLKLHL